MGDISESSRASITSKRSSDDIAFQLTYCLLTPVEALTRVPARASKSSPRNQEPCGQIPRSREGDHRMIEIPLKKETGIVADETAAALNSHSPRNKLGDRA
jgi:hypothetical protein